MSTRGGQEPWIALGALVREGDGASVARYLDALSPGEVARALSRIEEDDRNALLTMLAPDVAADLIEELPDAQGSDLIEDLPPEQAALIVDEIDSDHRADILAGLGAGDLEAILQRMDPEEAREARHLLTYPADTAGGIMITEYVVYPQDRTVGDVLDDLHRNAEVYSDFGMQYAYVQSANETLIGVLRLRDLVLSTNDKLISSVMIVNPVSVLADAPLDELEPYFDRYPFSGLPVVDHDGRIVGVVQRADVEEAHSERSDRAFMRFSGIISGEELRNMPVISRSMRRLAFLTINLALSLLSSFVIIYYQDTINHIIALAALIPVLANVSGCSGNQAVAVSIREMTLGLIKPRDMMRVARQEMGVGLINGIVLGALLGGYAYLWQGDAMLGALVGTALLLNATLSVILGGAIPLLLKRFNIDPSAAASPMLTTTMDTCGFFFILSFATLLVQG